MNHKGEIGCGIIIWIFVGLMCWSCYGCMEGGGKSEIREGTFVRIFMHEPGLYSVLDENLRPIEFRNFVRGTKKNVKLFKDVPANEKMWYKGEYFLGTYGNRTMGWMWIEIHIHNENDINGGDFEEGDIHHRHKVRTTPIK